MTKLNTNKASEAYSIAALTAAECCAVLNSLFPNTELKEGELIGIDLPMPHAAFLAQMLHEVLVDFLVVSREQFPKETINVDELSKTVADCFVGGPITTFTAFTPAETLNFLAQGGMLESILKRNICKVFDAVGLKRLSKLEYVVFSMRHSLQA